MSVDPNNPLEIIVDLSISDNDFVIVSDVEPVPDLSFFDQIRVFTDHLTGWVEPKSDNSHKLDLKYTANNDSIPKYVSCGGQWAETQCWHFDFDPLIYNEVLNMLSDKSLTYLEIGNNPAHAIVISEE